MRLPAELEFRKKKEMGASAYDYGMQEQDKCVSKKCYDDEDDDEEEDDYLYPRHPTPPDGGWAWVVMLGSFMCLFTVDGTCFSYGPLMPSLAKEFEASHSKVAWVGSTLAGSYLLAGPAVAAMCAKYGNRKVCIIGSIIACIGLLMSVHSESVDMMIATYGVIGGMGLGMVHLPAVVAVGHWFKKKRAFATGCAFVGAGLGQFVFPPLITWLVETYSWRGALYIMAGIHLNCAVYGMTFVPVNRWLAGSKPRRPINRKVEICRGDIMTALIESKKRERTISNGSLDNCVITRDNVLIKLDPKLFEGKRNNSIIARFRRQLGFSSQSLASSKNSLQGIPSIVIDAVHKDMNMKAAAAAAMAANNSGSVSLTGSPIYRPSGSHGVTRVQQLSGMVGLEKRGSLPMMSQGSNPAYLSSTKIESPSKESVNGSALALSQARVSKTQSCDVIPTSKMSPGPADSSASIDGENPNPVLSRSASDLQTHHTQFLPFGPGSLDGTDLRIQSIQLLSNGTSCAQELAAAKARGLRCRSSRSESSTHSFGGFSYTSPGSVHGSTVLYSSAGSLPQIQATLEEMEQLQASCEAIERSFPAECLHFVVNMLNLELLVNPVFLKFALSTFAVIMGFYIPFFFLPSKGEEVPYGMPLRLKE
ncbi:hypothetical protein EGW08_012113 [Elysia chlorotica]|uniref:Major facilitator superfamily (MFS) profile domain-containing protein n=1 Tax=Elysia chlorotica TaxID=188477 RepID=A0A433TEX7_ELYCH|nr:hypothetical protein EGW08_012113 [Elysia chlorotica]